MNRFRLLLCFVLIGLCGFTSSAWALYCNPTPGSGFSLNSLPKYVINQQVLIDALDKNALQIEVADLNKIIRCNGGAGNIFQNAFKTQGTGLTLTFSRLSELGFGLYLDVGGVSHPVPALNVCVAPDISCSHTYPDTDSNPIPFTGKVLLKRIAGTGSWQSNTKIPAGTEIARLQTYYRSKAKWEPSLTWVFILKNDLIPSIYTCSITQYDKNVTLPDVRRGDILAHGTGRYPGAQKAFKFNLACDAQAAVSVTFNGDTLSGTGTDSVLKNKLSGNDNVGIQLLFNDSTPVKMTEKLKVATSAQPTEQLSFNAYYYYKGGNVSSGPVKANTTFTFEYQ